MTNKIRPRKPTMGDVAEAAQVAPMTVSNTFRYPHRVQAATRERVLSVANKLGYTPNSTAGALASGKSLVVGLITPPLTNSNFADTVQGIGDVLRREGYRLFVSIARDSEEEFDAARAFIGSRVDGLILIGVDHSPPLRHYLKKTGIPIVETWSLDGPFIHMGVGFSMFDAAREMVELMLEKRYTKIGLVGYPWEHNHRFSERVRGFDAALEAAGLDPSLKAFSPADSGFSGGALAMNRLLEREPALQGVFCLTDVLAVGCVFECIRRGWAIPDRFGIAGFGDYEITQAIPPGLTTVHTRSMEIGRSAAEILVESIIHGTKKSRVVDVGYSIVSRSSI